MTNVQCFLGLVILLLAVSCDPDHPAQFSLVAWPQVYNIQQHNDSLYFSTASDGIFRFHPDHPRAVQCIGKDGSLPFRSMVFTKDGKLLACSYYAGVHYAARETLLTLEYARNPAWSIKLDEDGALWLAGNNGVYRQRGDSLVRFADVPEAHDLALSQTGCAVAHMNGITIFDRKSGAVVDQFLQWTVCWCIMQYDTFFIGGGQGRCAIINGKSCQEISLGPKDNLLWAITRDSSGTWYFGTQQGLYRSLPGSAAAECIGLKGVCVKSVSIDQRGKLWAGKFVGQKK
jgi:ligand-binding sensor domain-containing protein